MRAIPTWLGAWIAALSIMLFTAGQAQASIAACYDLTILFKPSDVKLAYAFVRDHGECIAKVEDPTFQAVAGSLTAMTFSGVLPKGQCTAAMNNLESPVAKQLLSVASADLLAAYLQCGCAVADSGITDKIKDLLEDVVECAKTFDPTGPIYAGLEDAGGYLGFSDLWGMGSNAHNANAGVGNGGAPTYAYTLPDCPTGKPLYASQYPGGNVQTCACPAPTQLYADGKFLEFGNAFKGETFTCIACPPDKALQNGTCQPCPTIQTGNGGYDLYGPNAAGTACVKVGGGGTVTSPCKLGEKWNGTQGPGAVCCASWQAFGVGKSCVNYCAYGQVYTGGSCSQCPDDTQVVNNTCQPCPPGGHSTAGGLCAAPFPTPNCPINQGILPGTTSCGPCPPDTQIVGGYCQACPFGSHSNGAGDICSVAFPQTQCTGGQAHPPGNPYACEVCPANTQAVDGFCQPCPPGKHSVAGGACVGYVAPLVCPPTAEDGTPNACARVCTGNTVRNPRRPGACIACPVGAVPNPDHTACRPAMSPANGLQNIRRITPSPVVQPVSPSAGGGG